MKLCVLLVYMFTHIFKGVLFCSIHVCLRWKVEFNQITFICKIDDLHHPVYFYDNYEREIAYCNIPHPSPECTPLPKQHTNVTVTQNPNKLETVVIVKGKIDQRLNGKWSCRHGTNLSEANVEINILTAKDTLAYNDYPTENDNPKESEFTFGVKCAMIIGGAIFATSVVTVLVIFGVVKLRKRSNAFIFTSTVNLNGPKYIRRDGSLRVICSSDETPFFSTANFLINGQTFASLRKYDKGCYSARVKCPLDSLNCYCSQDGKQYGLLVRASVRTMQMTVSCTMRFSKNGQSFTKIDSLIVQIHDPPWLNGETNIACNISSSVQIVCTANGNTGSFSEWVHSYRGKVIRTLPGRDMNNTSTISIDNCDFEDLGEYTCEAWNKIENETYWSNFTTHLTVNGAPTVLWIKSTGKDEKPTVLSVGFYSPQTPTSVQWTKDLFPVGNFTGIDIKVYQKNITIEMYGKQLVHKGHVTSLTVNEGSTSVYSVVLKNEFGKYSHQFEIEAGKDYFSLRTVVWILICLAVFLLTVTIATVLFSRRSRIYLKRFENAGNVSIYYAAPTSVYNISPYAATRLEYEEPINIPQATRSTLRRENEESGEREDDNETNHYIEVY